MTAFGRHLGEDTTGAIRAVCGFADPVDMQSAFEGAGFGQVEIKTAILDQVAENGSVLRWDN